MKTRTILIVALFIFLTNICSAASLWLSGKDLYSSKGARDFRPGDIVTIEIAEQSTAQSQATTKTKKDAKVEISTGPKIPIFKNVMSQLVGKNQAKNEFDGNGSTSRTGKLSGTITATVLEVMQNGNLLVEGSRSIRINRETQIMRVRGVARPMDIDASNTIDSKLLADAQIKFKERFLVENNRF
jgi:flagellar L-ring protein precursor FlgH